MGLRQHGRRIISGPMVTWIDNMDRIDPYVVTWIAVYRPISPRPHLTEQLYNITCQSSQQKHNKVKIINNIQGRPQDLAGGGAKNFFFRFGNLHVAKRHAAHGKAMRFARGFGGMPPRENFLKWCNLVRFGVHFDQILSLKNFNNYHFFNKNFKNCNFLYKRIDILDTRLQWGNYSREEIVRKIYD